MFDHHDRELLLRLDRDVLHLAGRLGDIDRKLGVIIRGLRHIDMEEQDEMGDLNEITSKVQESVGVAQSAITLIQGLAAEIHANADDPAALHALADSLSASDAALSAAIQANMVTAPSEPAPVEPPAEPAPVDDTPPADEPPATTEPEPQPVDGDGNPVPTPDAGDTSTPVADTPV